MPRLVVTQLLQLLCPDRQEHCILPISVRQQCSTKHLCGQWGFCSGLQVGEGSGTLSRLGRRGHQKCWRLCRCTPPHPPSGNQSLVRKNLMINVITLVPYTCNFHAIIIFTKLPYISISRIFQLYSKMSR